MSDLHLVQTAEWDFDLDFNGSDLVLDESLETATAVSLFTWARRGLEDPNPDPTGDPMGWWGDATADPAGDSLGSKIWLDLRSKITPDQVQQIQKWGADSLAWATQDGVAKSVSVTLQRAKVDGDHVVVSASLEKPDGGVETYRWELNWNTQTPKVAP